MKNTFTKTDRQYFFLEEDTDAKIEDLKIRLQNAVSIQEEIQIEDEIENLKGEKDYYYNLAYDL